MLLFTLSACSAPGVNSGDRRENINNMRQQVLSDLYELKPAVKSYVNSAPGYAVFSNFNVNVILASVGSGYGMVVNNNSGSKTYMKMAEVGVGFGMGVKDFRVVFVFDNRAVMARFIDIGLSVGVQADAAAKADDKGAAIAQEAVLDGIKVYQLTENGLALQATIKGTKFWRDNELN